MGIYQGDISRVRTETNTLDDVTINPIGMFWWEIEHLGVSKYHRDDVEKPLM